MNEIRDYFDRYPTHNDVYKCGGVLFHTEGAALSYGKGNVTHYKRSDVTDATAELKQELEPVKTEIQSVAFSEMTYKELQAKCKEFNLTTKNNKKATLIEALETFNKKQ